MPPRPLKIVYLTAGAAGMICGSCLHDNTLARALLELGHDVQLIPLYTPIRTDETDVTSKRIFYGGINTYLQQNVPLFRWLPKWLDRWLDQPWLIDWAAGKSVKIEPNDVADLAVSMLQGTAGHQRKEVERLVDWLCEGPAPDIVVFSNILTAGCVPEIKKRLSVPVVVTLQGDDIFLQGLPEPQQSQALREIHRLASSIDGYLSHSQYYADAMAGYLGLPRERIEVVPLGIDTKDFRLPASPPLPVSHSTSNGPPTIGYLARLAPEKGLHILADAFVALKKMPGMDQARLRIAGWRGSQYHDYVEQIFSRLHAAGLSDSFEYLDEVDRRAKLDFLASLDVLSVPTIYREPKGLYVLEALAAGVPVVAPEHGAFPEVIAQTQGGLLHRPGDAAELAGQLHKVLTDRELHSRLAQAGRANVHEHRSAKSMANKTVVALWGVLNGQRAGDRPVAEPALAAEL